MTFSIVGCDLERGDWGVAVASKFPSVGSVVPWARAGVGVVATQSYANTDYGPDGLALLAGGKTAREALEALTANDPERSRRQVGAVDARGGAATFTGQDCLAWAGGMSGEGFACQGNILAGAAVVDAMAGAFRATDGELVDRLLAALAAADAAGGDRRGRQSAAVLVVRESGGYDGRNDRYIDLRVDDHADPVGELLRVFEVFDREYLVRNDPLLPAEPALVIELQQRLSATGHLVGQPTGRLDGPTRDALALFAGQHNLESKIRDDDLLYDSLVRGIRDVSALAGEGRSSG